MKNLQIIIVDNEGIIAPTLKKQLSQHFIVHEVKDNARINTLLQKNTINLVVVGSIGKQMTDGLDRVEKIRQENKSVPVVLISKFSSEARIIAALRAGVSDYIKTPFIYEELALSIDRTTSDFSQYTPVKGISPAQSCSSLLPEIIGNSLEIQKIKNYLLKVAATESTVLITGESGTGKELVAEMIHHHSPRNSKPFVCVNSAAIPESLVESELFGYDRGAFTGADAAKQGLFEQAAGGSVFLDEISDMSPLTQAKVLRVIENKKVMRVGGRWERPMDVRIIAATNQELEKMVKKGTFRLDLYYRLNVARIHMPPLRERKEDIPILLEYFIRDLNQQSGRCVQDFSPKAWVALLHYDWQGNVRELKNLLESSYIALTSNRISYSDLPTMFQLRFEEMSRGYVCERDRVLNALFASNWNKSKAAKKLNWSRMTLYRKIEQHSIVENRPIRSWALKECDLFTS
jgi:DNA-binding NtrC family response regulator